MQIKDVAQPVEPYVQHDHEKGKKVLKFKRRPGYTGPDWLNSYMSKNSLSLKEATKCRHAQYNDQELIYNNIIIVVAYKSKRFAIAFLLCFSFSASLQCFWMAWQKLIPNICPVPAVSLCEINSKGRLKPECLEFSSLATKDVSSLPQSLWPPIFARW